MKADLISMSAPGIFMLWHKSTDFLSFFAYLKILKDAIRTLFQSHQQTLGGS